MAHQPLWPVDGATAHLRQPGGGPWVLCAAFDSPFSFGTWFFLPLSLFVIAKMFYISLQVFFFFLFSFFVPILFISHTFECLLCAKHWSRHWQLGIDWGSQGLCVWAADIQRCKPVLLKHECACKSFEHLVKMHILIQEVSVGLETLHF